MKILKQGILNPNINFLLACVRHTNMLVIADRGFSFCPEIETVDVRFDGIPNAIGLIRTGEIIHCFNIILESA